MASMPAKEVFIVSVGLPNTLHSANRSRVDVDFPASNINAQHEPAAAGAPGGLNPSKTETSPAATLRFLAHRSQPLRQSAGHLLSAILQALDARLTTGGCFNRRHRGLRRPVAPSPCTPPHTDAS